MASAFGEAGRRKGLGPAQETAGDGAPASSSTRTMRAVAIPIDSVADAAIAARAMLEAHPHCGVCDALVSGDDGGRGLLIWSRGDEIRYEEPHLCESCANVLGVSALALWEREEEDE